MSAERYSESVAAVLLAGFVAVQPRVPLNPAAAPAQALSGCSP